MCITEEKLVEAYGNSNPHERFLLIYKNYSVFPQLVDCYETGLFNRILFEVEYNRRKKCDAMRRLGRDKESLSSKNGKRQWANVQLAKEVGESRNQIHRYLRLVYVIPSILDLVDKKALALMTAVEISYLSPEVQEMLYAYMLENDICKSFQIYALRDYFKDHDTITRMEMIRILNENAPFNENNRFQKIIITREKLKEYFPVFYTKSQMEKVLFDLLREWKKMNAQ